MKVATPGQFFRCCLITSASSENVSGIVYGPLLPGAWDASRGCFHYVSYGTTRRASPAFVFPALGVPRVLVISAFAGLRHASTFEDSAHLQSQEAAVANQLGQLHRSDADPTPVTSYSNL